MAPEGTETSLQHAPRTMADLIEQLGRFDGPPEAFLAALLDVQIRSVGASAGAILRADAQGRPGILASQPALESGAAPPVWLATAGEAVADVAQGGKALVKPLHSTDQLYGEAARSHVIVAPLRGGMAGRGAGAYVMDSADPKVLAEATDRLELTCGLIALYETRISLQRREFDFRRLRSAMEILAAVNEQQRFAGASMSLVNELAARWECERVSLGLLKGRYVQLKALSHTEKFSRKMELVQDIESAAEECFDQDIELLAPPPAESMHVTRTTERLGARHGPNAVLSLPLRIEGKCVGVVVAERTADRPFRLEEAEAVRLAADLSTPRVHSLYETDRWLGARAAAGMRKGLAVVLGPKHTWLKVAAIVILAILLVVTLVDGTYRADGTFVIQATNRRIVSAPADGQIARVFVEPGQTIGGTWLTRKKADGTTERYWQGDKLATLDTQELTARLSKAIADKQKYNTEARIADAAVREDPEAPAKAQQARANERAAQATIDLLQFQIGQATIRNPIATEPGADAAKTRLLSGDLKKLIGSPVSRGDAMFEVGPTDTIHAELLIPEDEMAEVELNKTGEISNPANPKQRVGFTIIRIVPVAEVVDQKNVFRIHAELDERPDWAKPGTEGVAKVTIGPRKLGWIWTRRLVNWVRMKLWI